MYLASRLTDTTTTLQDWGWSEMSTIVRFSHRLYKLGFSTLANRPGETQQSWWRTHSPSKAFLILISWMSTSYFGPAVIILKGQRSLTGWARRCVRSCGECRSRWPRCSCPRLRSDQWWIWASAQRLAAAASGPSSPPRSLGDRLCVTLPHTPALGWGVHPETQRHTWDWLGFILLLLKGDIYNIELFKWDIEWKIIFFFGLDE